MLASMGLAAMEQESLSVAGMSAEGMAIGEGATSRALMRMSK
ncbi:MAG: hypothetical protein ABI442_05980 [Gemmatimonadaceae bacterium]